jgi:hypothetical protein
MARLQAHIIAQNSNGWGNGFVTSRHPQGQPLGIGAGSLHPDGSAFHGAGLRMLGAATHGVMEIGQTEIDVFDRCHGLHAGVTELSLLAMRAGGRDNISIIVAQPRLSRS